MKVNFAMCFLVNLFFICRYLSKLFLSSFESYFNLIIPKKNQCWSLKIQNSLIKPLIKNLTLILQNRRLINLGHLKIQHLSLKTKDLLIRQFVEFGILP